MNITGSVRVLLDELQAALSVEAAAGIVAGTAMAALRDPALLRARNLKHPSELFARELSTIDRAGIRGLLRVAEAFAESDPAQIAPLGLTRLTLLANAAPATRTTLLPSAPTMTTADLRRAVREAGDRFDVADPLTATGAASPYAAGDAARIAGELLRTATRALRDMDAAGLRAARAASRLREEPSIGSAADELMAIELGLGRSDVDRLCAIAERTVTVATETRERIGIRGLRAIAGVEDEAQREALIRAAAEPSANAEAIVARARNLGAARLRPAVAAPETVGAVAVAPYDLLFLTDRPSEQERTIDATPVPLLEQLILRATAPGETILDLTAGMGTTARVAAAMGRKAVSVDPIDPPLAPEIIVGDGRTVDLPSGPFALALLHPPLPGERFVTERFSGRTQPGDLSVLQPASYMAAVGELLERAKGLIAPDGEIAIVARTAHLRGAFHDWPARFSHAAEAMGLIAVDRLIVVEAPEERVDRERLEIGRAVREGRSVPVTLVALRFRLPTAADRRRR